MIETEENAKTALQAWEASGGLFYYEDGYQKSQDGGSHIEMPHSLARVVGRKNTKQRCVPIVIADGNRKSNSRQREISRRTPHRVSLVMDVDSKVTERIIAQPSSKQNQERPIT